MRSAAAGLLAVLGLTILGAAPVLAHGALPDGPPTIGSLLVDRRVGAARAAIHEREARLAERVATEREAR